jgi:hypothetical protein
MAEKPTAPGQSNLASDKVKAEGDRENDRTNERNEELDQPHASGRDRLDPIELRDVRDETSERHRRGEDVGASGISNRTLAEEQEEQAEVPPRQTRKAGGA